MLHSDRVFPVNVDLWLESSHGVKGQTWERQCARRNYPDVWSQDELSKRPNPWSMPPRLAQMWTQPTRSYIQAKNLLLVNKVDVQNNILYTLREASHVAEKAIFHLSFPALIYQKKFLVLKLMLTKPSALIWYVISIYYIESNFFHNFGSGGGG